MKPRNTARGGVQGGCPCGGGTEPRTCPQLQDFCTRGSLGQRTGGQGGPGALFWSCIYPIWLSTGTEEGLTHVPVGRNHPTTCLPCWPPIPASERQEPSVQALTQGALRTASP
ncbi:uncharacterized protein LOC119521955 isoform X4 [Choloepus didactylus]|uniref:uncharacterized protein LOC119521955 isoform X4 n=1 Tax=Choloepus didactylus TaxID=27675 RepID=UPI00189EC3C6|nr:uncharacterized protein LOC119521955 isoform X4 [Choloepus didactylus]